MVKEIQNFPFAACPLRCDQQLFWSISGYAVDDNGRTQMLQTVDHEINIRIASQHFKFSDLIISCQICPAKNMEKLKLDALDICSIQIFYRFQNVVMGFTGKSQDCVDDYFQSGSTQA